MLMVKTHITVASEMKPKEEEDTAGFIQHAVIQKSLFHIHLTMEAFTVLAACFLITSFLRHALMILCFARTTSFEQ